MNIGTAFSAFFAILFKKDKAKFWRKGQSGELIGLDAHKKELDKAEEKGQQQGQKDSASELDAKVKEFETQLKELKNQLNSNGKDRSDAVYTLVLLQREGRLVDFLQEDISAYSDEQIGAAVRQVHAGCRKVLKDYFSVKALRSDNEGETVEVPSGFNPVEYELTGNITGSAPYKGALRHRGWKASQVSLPERQAGQKLEVIAPAEVEV